MLVDTLYLVAGYDGGNVDCTPLGFPPQTVGNQLSFFIIPKKIPTLPNAQFGGILSMC